MHNEDDQPPKVHEPIQPYWLPENMVLDDLPNGVKAAMEGIIGPGYRELVVGAPDALERLAAMSLVHLSHLEALEQVELGRDLAAAEAKDRDKRVAEHVRLVGAKLRAVSFVHRLRQARSPINPPDRETQRRAPDRK
jgi:hypothetical protein